MLGPQDDWVGNGTCTKPDDMIFHPVAHTDEKENWFSHVILWQPQAFCGICASIHALNQQTN